jgi:hypothetical protein
MVWIQSPDRQAVTTAQARIDQLLAADPFGHGTPVSEGLYVIEERPLRAQFQVPEDDRVVTVVSVREAP